MNPTTKVVKIHTVKMIAASEKILFGDSVTSAAGAESRDRFADFWDDDEDIDF